MCNQLIWKLIVLMFLYLKGQFNVHCGWRNFNPRNPHPTLYLCKPLTIPFLETVAGEALSILEGSKIILVLGFIGIRSPFARVSVLLSSRTEFKFSIHIASTGPSKTIHIYSSEKN